jgi:oxygen-dependent protoporphyrinogen oxidase
MRTIVIIGGGIAGLSAALEATNGGNASRVRVEIIEASDRLGGALHTTTFGGRTIDLGADGFLARRPEVVELVTQLGRRDDLRPIDASGAWLWLRGKLRRLPEGMVLGVPVSLRQVRALKGLPRRARWAARRDWYRPRRGEFSDDATIGEIVRRKLGDDLANLVVEPMIGGIQAGRIDDLSAAAVFPALLTAARNGGSLMKAMAAHGPAVPGPRTSAATTGPAFYTLVGGTASLIDTLASELLRRGVVITLDTPVVRVRGSNDAERWLVETTSHATPADDVIFAISAPKAAEIFQHGALEELSTMPHASAAMVTLRLPSDTPLPATGTGILVPLRSPYGRGDTFLTTAVTFLDRKWPHLRRDDVLVRLHVGRSDDLRQAGMDNNALVVRCVAELERLLGSSLTVLESLVQRWPQALPQYTPGHEERVAEARRQLETRGVYLCGMAYDGVGIPASVGSGRRVGRLVR